MFFTLLIKINTIIFNYKNENDNATKLLLKLLCTLCTHVLGNNDIPIVECDI